MESMRRCLPRLFPRLRSHFLITSASAYSLFPTNMLIYRSNHAFRERVDARRNKGTRRWRRHCRDGYKLDRYSCTLTYIRKHVVPAGDASEFRPRSQQLPFPGLRINHANRANNHANMCYVFIYKVSLLIILKPTPIP